MFGASQERQLIYIFSTVLMMGLTAAVIYFSGVGFQTVVSFIGFSLPNDFSFVVLYGSFITLIFALLFALLTHSMRNKKLEELFPIQAQQQLSNYDRRFIIYLLETKWKRLNKLAARLVRQAESINQEQRRRISSLFVYMELIRHLQDQIVHRSHLPQGIVAVVNEIQHSRGNQQIEIIKLSQFDRDMNMEDRLTKISELREQGFFLIENFGYIRIHSKKQLV